MITEQDAWKIVRRFMHSLEPDERETVYDLVSIIDHLMLEQEMADKKEQKEEQAEEKTKRGF